MVSFWGFWGGSVLVRPKGGRGALMGLRQASSARASRGPGAARVGFLGKALLDEGSGRVRGGKGKIRWGLIIAGRSARMRSAAQHAAGGRLAGRPAAAVCSGKCSGICY